jgi:fucokinase
VSALLAHPPGIAPLARVGRTLCSDAAALRAASPSEAASRFHQAGLFLRRAGLEEEQERAREQACLAVREAVEAGISPGAAAPMEAAHWVREEVSVEAPPRIDLAGGWSDTPPFCLDSGGAVLNIAVQLNGEYPIRALARRLAEPLVRCVSEGTGETATYRCTEEVLAAPDPGSPFSISRVALRLLGIAAPELDLRDSLRRLGGGVEIRTAVRLPIGSGLGTSSILAAAVLRALTGLLGYEPDEQELSERVMVLEQVMTTGGGWQDQAGGIFPGAKLITSGPGLRQRLHVEPVRWNAALQAEFCRRMVLYYTGLRRMAKDLLSQIVGSYLAREVSTVNVLHTIKTLALEMAHALEAGDWDYVGRLMNRHWKLNQQLDPNTTNAPLNALLELAAPYLAGAKLAGAGGGGFMILLARDPDAAAELRRRLSGSGGAVYDAAIARSGPRVTV